MRLNLQKLTSTVESLSLGRRILVLALLCGFIIVISWQFFLGPNLDRKAQLESEMESLEMDIQRFSRQAAKWPDLEERRQELEMELEAAETLLPRDAHALERLLASFERLGNEKGVNFLLFQPGEEQIHDYYASRTVQLRIEGKFHDLINYFDALTRLDRLVSLQSLRLRPDDQIQEGGNGMLTAESRLLVYRSLTQQEQAAREED